MTETPRLLLGRDLSEEESVEAVVRWVGTQHGWTEDELERAMTAAGLSGDPPENGRTPASARREPHDA
jgi:hypothetical protein